MSGREKPDVSASDLRFAPRRAKKIPAVAYLDGILTGVPCFITDISTTGARVKLQPGWDSAFRHAADYAKRLHLVERIEKVSYDCAIVHRGELELGLKFLSAPKLSAPPPKRRA